MAKDGNESKPPTPAVSRPRLRRPLSEREIVEGLREATVKELEAATKDVQAATEKMLASPEYIDRLAAYQARMLRGPAVPEVAPAPAAPVVTSDQSSGPEVDRIKGYLPAAFPDGNIDISTPNAKTAARRKLRWAMKAAKAVPGKADSINRALGILKKRK
jgi:hypothetical protein